MNSWCRILCFCFIVLSMISACSSHEVPTAPIVNGWHEPIAKQGVYIVRPGDGLSAIAWRYGVDYRSIVRINHLSEPYTLQTGQKLYLVQPTAKDKQIAAAAAAKPVTAKAAVAKPIAAKPVSEPQKSTVAAKPAKKVTPVAAPSSNLAWQWPAA